tara:strand:- start:769 stop:1878 length:1110 start_codon:yes stop_codon:yes gene_type:complete
VNKNPRKIRVELTNNPYEIIIGGSGIEGLGKELLNLGIKPQTKVLLVTNSIIAAHYGDQLKEYIQKAGFQICSLIIKEGEENKNLRTIEQIHNEAFKIKLERGSLVIALGGGVVGDIAGFAAATWLRGISVIQIPTTLLAMVDASIGGKTGVNHSGGKNLIGAFHQPKLVLIDPTTLKTLPEREFRAGMAEVIKYAVIGDPLLFSLLEEASHIDTLSKLSSHLLEELLERSVAAKAKIVASDEKESGLRAILNYGHTFGHVIENLCGYGNFLHGEAVAIGMVAVGELALIKEKWSKSDADRQKELLKKAGLPISWPDIDSEDVLKTLEGDKKVKDGDIRFVIPNKIGKVELSNEIHKNDIKECLKRLKS